MGNPAISPDGGWLVFRRNASAVATGELYRLRLGKGMTAVGNPRRLTPAALDGEYPTWIPGGKEILFSAKGSLWRLAVDGEGPPSDRYGCRLINRQGPPTSAAIGPDGR